MVACLHPFSALTERFHVQEMEEEEGLVNKDDVQGTYTGGHGADGNEPQDENYTDEPI